MAVLFKKKCFCYLVYPFLLQSSVMCCFLVYLSSALDDVTSQKTAV